MIYYILLTIAILSFWYYLEKQPDNSIVIEQQSDSPKTEQEMIKTTPKRDAKGRFIKKS